MKLYLSLALILCGLALIKGQSESMSEEDLDISPEVTRELLVSALKLLGRERTNRMQLKQGAMKQVIMTRPLSQPMAIIAQPPCSKEQSPEEFEESGTDAGSEATERRSIVTTATRVETNPYTGQLHYVHYPVIYPTNVNAYHPYMYR